MELANNDNNNNTTNIMNDFKDWIHSQNKYYCKNNNIIIANNDINILSKNITVNSSLRDYEGQHQDVIKFLNTFFHNGIIHKYTVDKNILRVKIQFTHEHIIYVNLEVSFDTNNLINFINMSDGFNDRFF